MDEEKNLDYSLENMPNWNNLSIHDQLELKKFKLLLELCYNGMDKQEAYDVIYGKEINEA